MKKFFYHSKHAQAGFTIVELMIATLVFSVILIAITVGVVTFTNDYYRGINSSTTQNVARNIIDTVSQAIQFNDANVVPMPALSPTTYCIGSVQFDFVLSKELGTDTNHALWETPSSGCAAISPPIVTSKELLGPKMRLANFSINPVGLAGNLYTIDVRVVYGDKDLLCSPAVNGSCTSTATMSPANLARHDLTCKSQAGSQFCSASELTTTAQIRAIPSLL